MRYNKGQFNINFGGQAAPQNGKITYGEFFAGGLGCASAAKRNPFIEVRWVLNHDKVAIKTANHHMPEVKVFWADVYDQDEREMEPVHWIQGSFECDEFSPANAGNEVDVKSYMMGWELYRYTAWLQPLLLTVENVPGVKKWAPLDAKNKRIEERSGEEFERWKAAMMALGYQYKESIRCAADDGIATTRTRYFAAFYREGIEFEFAETTHNEFGTGGLSPWVPCRDFIDLENYGNSIFGRQYNEAIPKQHRKPLVKNSLRRIAGGIKKEAPDFHQYICSYYGGKQGEKRDYSLDKPLPTQTTENRHQLVTVEMHQFIADYCYGDFYQQANEPLKTQLTRQTKTLVTLEKQQFVAQYYGGSDQSNSIDEPLNTIPCRDIHQLVTIEKAQYIAHYFNSSGKPETNVQGIDRPINSLTTHDQAQLVTLLDGFDIKVRFLSKQELAAITSFPRDFFDHVSHKDAIKMIGNAVPPEWFYNVILEPNTDTVLEYINKRESA
jgi:DNA (cytosine-5)-methyltransferase 1